MTPASHSAVSQVPLDEEGEPVEVDGATSNEDDKRFSPTEDQTAQAPEGQEDSVNQAEVSQVDQDSQASQSGDSDGRTWTKEELEAKRVPELKELAKEANVEGYSSLLKAELIEVLLND